MNDEHQPYRLNMGIPNGIILSLIGVLGLITPLMAEMTGQQLVMDIIAGLVLLVGGTSSLLWGLKRRREYAREDQLRK